MLKERNLLPARRRLAPIAEAAAVIDCHPRTIRRRIADGSLAAYRVGPRMLRVDLDEVDQLMRPVPTAAQAVPA